MRTALKLGFLLFSTALILIFSTSCTKGKGPTQSSVQDADRLSLPVSPEATSAGDTSGAVPSPPISLRIEEVLKELELLKPPEGVDTGVFAQLKSALAEELGNSIPITRDPAEGRVNFSPAGKAGLKPSVLQGKDGGVHPEGSPRGGQDPALLGATAESKLRLQGRRFVSKPPTGSENRVDDLALVDFDAVSATFAFNYKNVGDYNEDGIVNIADITPLAEHFFQRIGDDPEVEVIDGDGNGQVGISDITPVAQNFFTTCAGYQLIAATEAEPDNWQDVLEGFVSLQEMEEQGGWNGFEITVNYGSYRLFRVIPVDNEGLRGEPSNLAQIQVSPPNITDVSPNFGIRGQEQTFSVTATGTRPISYVWDFGGGAEPNNPTGGSVNVTLQGAGEYDASVTGTNAIGSDTYYFTLVVQPVQPDVLSVSPTQGVSGTDVTFTLEVTGDEPIDYLWDFDGGATPSQPTSDLPEVTVTLLNPGVYDCVVTAKNMDYQTLQDTYAFTLNVVAPGEPPYIVSLSPQAGEEGSEVNFSAVVTGDEPISYTWNFGGGANPNTSNDPAPTVTLGAPNTYNASLYVENPYGSDTFNFDLVVYPAGASGIYKIVVTNGNRDPSLAVVAGAPAILYGGRAGEDYEPAMFVRAKNLDGTEWNDPIAIPYEPPVVTGANNTLITIGGEVPLPAVCSAEFYLIGGGNYLFSRANDLMGNSWPPFTVAHNVQQVTVLPHALSFVIDSANDLYFPAIAFSEYLAGSPESVLFMRSIDEEGKIWLDAVTVIEEVALGDARTSLILAEGNPAIAFSSTSGLTYVRANDPMGDSWGEQKQITGESVVTSHMTLIDGRPAIAFANAGMIRYTISQDPRGDAWARIQSIAGELDMRTGKLTLAEINGNPAVAFHDYAIGGGYMVKYVFGSSPDGGVWEVVNVAEPDLAKPYISLAEVAGRPAITYGKWGGDELVFVRANDADGRDWPSPSA